MKKVTRRVFLTTGAALTTIALGEISKSQRVSAQTKEINLYSSRHYNTDNTLYDDFRRQTGIKVNLVEGKGKELLERIKSEGRNSKADIFLTADAGNLWEAQQQNIFTPISSQILTQNIPSNLRDPDNHWFGFSKRLRVIMYNKSKVNPSELSTYEDLASPKWKDRIVMRSSSNIYNQSLVAWLLTIHAVHGQDVVEEWCKGLVSNFARSPQGNDRAQIEAVASGLADVTLANTYYLASYYTNKRAIFNQIGIFFPNQKGSGAHVNISGGGVIKTAPNREGAIKFLEYLVSPSAQKFFAEGNNEYPVVDGVSLSPALQSFGSYKADNTNVANYGRNLANAVKVMDRAGWK